MLSREQKIISYVMNGNNYNQRMSVHPWFSVLCRTIIGQGHSGMEPKVLVKEKNEQSD